jgi:membrane-bound serine protease (ClpP class)
MFAGCMSLIAATAGAPRIRWSVALALTLPFAAITSFLLSIALRARRNKVATGAEAMIGLTALTLGPLNPSGVVLVRGEYWRARAGFDLPGSRRVRIIGIDGLTLRVAPADEGESQ